MAYFARDDTTRRQSPPRRQGKHVGGPVAVPDTTRNVLTRDQIIEQNITSMQGDAASGANGGVLRFVTDSEKTNVRQRNANHKPDNDIFGPPVIAKAPRPRVRTGISDEELQKIWAEDERKAEAASRMERGTTLVDKMVADPVNPVVHSARAKDARAPPRKHIDLLTGTTQERNRQANEPAGFAGMGTNCKPTPRQGRSCKPVEEFQPPEMRQKPRAEGRRTRFPPDTFSFQDDANTFSS